MVLVIDGGTTNIKAFLFDAAGKPVCSASCSTKTIYSGPGRVEQNAGDWWRAAGNAIKKLENKRSAKIDAIVTSTQGGTFVPLDKKLEPLQAGITWLDNRAESEAGTLNRRYGRRFFYYKTGRYLRSWTTLAKFLWFKRHERDVYRETSRISFVADYLNYKMTGRFFMDQTAAGMTSFFNVRSGTWDNDLLDIAKIESNSLPEIVPAGKPGGVLTKEAAKLLSLSEDIPIISGGHDQYCASLGAGAMNHGDCLLSCGTAWALLVCTEKLIFEPESEWTSGRHLLDKNFGLMGPIGNGGVILDWVKKNMRLSCRVISLQATEKDRVKVIPYFSEGRGSIENLSLASSPENIYRATLKALVHLVSDYLNQIKGKVKLKKLFLVGGGAREPLLLPMLAEITKLKTIVPDVNEAAARGAALLAIKYLEEK